MIAAAYILCQRINYQRGYLRVRAGKHFPTDAITGFIAGGLVVVLAPHFHRPKNNLKNKKVILIPSLGVGMASLQMLF